MRQLRTIAERRFPLLNSSSEPGVGKFAGMKKPVTLRRHPGVALRDYSELRPACKPQQETSLPASTLV